MNTATVVPLRSPAQAQAAPQQRLDALTEEELSVVVDQVSSILRRWDLSERERARVMDVPLSTLRRWEVQARQRGLRGRPTFDQYMRMSLILGIHKALNVIHATPGHDALWLRSANEGPLFAGHAPLALMLSGGQPALWMVRRHLDAVRGA